jgi:class 3 adenylate cyclase
MRVLEWGGGLGRLPVVNQAMDPDRRQRRLLALPAGTVTFLLTDIEGSSRLWESAGEAMPGAVGRHYDILDVAIARHGGVRPVEQGEGDSVVAAFTRAGDALVAALEAQRALHAEDWPDGVALRVRMALHTGDAELRDQGNYFGAALNRCARLRGIACGGQVLLSRATHDLVDGGLPDGVELVDLGVHRLRDLGRPEHVFALRLPISPRSSSRCERSTRCRTASRSSSRASSAAAASSPTSPASWLRPGC